jgi:hypothetical protein
MVGSLNTILVKRLINAMKTYSCGGKLVSPVSSCVNDGAICSGVGTCSTDNKYCLCPPDREGQYCELAKVSSSDLAIILGTPPP